MVGASVRPEGPAISPEVGSRESNRGIRLQWLVAALTAMVAMWSTSMTLGVAKRPGRPAPSTSVSPIRLAPLEATAHSPAGRPESAQPVRETFAK